MDKITYRSAKPEDADALTQLAIASKRHWEYSDELIELWTPELTFTQHSIQSRIVTVAEYEGTLVGVSGLTLGKSSGELADLWILPPWIGKGIGRGLLNRAMATVEQHGFKTVTIVSDPNASAFYKRMGATQIGWHESKPAGRRLPIFELTSNSQHSSLKI